jgi:hypothetical protein
MSNNEISGFILTTSQTTQPRRQPGMDDAVLKLGVLLNWDSTKDCKSLSVVDVGGDHIFNKRA